MQPTFEKKVIVYGLSIAILAGLTFVIGQILVENGNNVLGNNNNNKIIKHQYHIMQKDTSLIKSLYFKILVTV